MGSAGDVRQDGSKQNTLHALGLARKIRGRDSDSNTLAMVIFGNWRLF